MLDYDTIYDTLYALQEQYPNLIDVYTAQEAPFELPSPGSCGSSGPCRQVYARITDETTLPDKDRPEVFLSGALHGNERVGPTTTLEFVRMLLKHYTASTTSTASTSTRSQDWLTRLVSRRALWVMPSANAYGYYHNQREENDVDPNRDFPYNVANPTQCMKTIAARSINELWRRHAFQIAITFHAGQQSISSTWGAYNHPAPNDIPPDDVGQMSLIKEMSTYGAEFQSNNKRYGYGRLNDNVYPVNGGMEDWAYGAAWEKGVVGQGCTPTTFGGYAQEKTTYGDTSLRVVNILVETSDSKSPYDSTFGIIEGVLNPAATGFRGHVPRNMRLALLVSDVVEPYVTWFAGSYWMEQLVSMSTDHQLDSNMVATSDSPVWLYPSTSTSSGALLEWSVGGAMTVDATELVLVKWPTSQFHGLSCQCVVGNSFRSGNSPIRVEWDDLNPISIAVGKGNVRAQSPWSAHKSEKIEIEGANAKKTLYELILQADPTAVSNGNEYVVLSRAAVDGKFLDSLPSNKVWPNGMAPQSNWVRHRTDTEWSKETTDRCHRVQGRKWWYSEIPLCIQMKKERTLNEEVKDESVGNNDNDYTFVVEVNINGLVGKASSGAGVLQIAFDSKMAPLGVQRVRELVDASKLM